MSANIAPLHRWTRHQYEHMVSSGIFHPEERVELVDGDIVDRSPQSSYHSVAVRLIEDALRAVFGSGFDVRAQLPLALDETSEPEPDIAVVTGSPRDYRNAHPKTAVLIVEVADTTLAYDRGRKKALYARNRIPEYWVVNLKEDCLEAYRAAEQEDYQSQLRLHRGDVIRPVYCPTRSIQIVDILP